MDELRLARRRLSKHPAATLASIATLACAIGAAAVTWSTLSAVLIHPLPVASPERLFVVSTHVAGRTGPVLYPGFLYPRYRRIRESGAFERTAAQWASPHTLLVTAGDLPVRTNVGFATCDFFDLLGIAPVVGRGFTESEDRRGAPPVVLLTHRYWRQAFNEDRSILGRTLVVNGKAATIIGVLPRRFRGTNLADPVDLYLPFHTIADVGGPGTNYFAEPHPNASPTAGTMIVGRLRPGGTTAEATARIRALEDGSPARQREDVVLVNLDTAAVPAAARPGMLHFSRLLAGTIVLLLIAGCSTVGMLLLIRTEARREEFAMCMALGASRARLARGIAVEGALLAIAGAVLSLPIAWWLFRLIRVFQLPGRISVDLLDLSLDTRALGLMIGAATAAVVLIALVAGVFGFRARIGDALRSRAGATPRVGRRATRAVLVSTQVAVAVTLVAGSGVFTRSLIAALSLNGSTDMSRILIGTIQLAPYGYTPERAAEFFEALQTRLSVVPTVRAVALNTNDGGMSPFGKIAIDGVPRQFPSMVWYLAIDDRYFQAMGINVEAGRPFSRDDRRGAPPVAIVSASLARLIGAGTPILGRRIEALSDSEAPMEIVGTASDVVTSVSTLEPLVVYQPLAQAAARPYRNITVRAEGVAQARREVAAAIRQLDPRVTSTALRTLEDRIAEEMAPQRLGATVLGALGVIAVLLTLLGIYVVSDSMASIRLREMGVRAALGASPRQLGTIVVAEMTRLVAIGLVAGGVLAWLGAGTIRTFMFRVQPLDPATLVLVASGMIALALAVSLRPALRAARVDLATVLRAQ